MTRHWLRAPSTNRNRCNLDRDRQMQFCVGHGNQRSFPYRVVFAQLRIAFAQPLTDPRPLRDPTASSPSAMNGVSIGPANTPSSPTPAVCPVRLPESQHVFAGSRRRRAGPSRLCPEHSMGSPESGVEVGIDVDEGGAGSLGGTTMILQSAESSCPAVTRVHSFKELIAVRPAMTTVLSHPGSIEPLFQSPSPALA